MPHTVGIDLVRTTLELDGIIPFQMIHDGPHLSIWAEYGIVRGECKSGLHGAREINAVATMYGLVLDDAADCDNGLHDLWFTTVKEIAVTTAAPAMQDQIQEVRNWS